MTDVRAFIPTPWKGVGGSTSRGGGEELIF